MAKKCFTGHLIRFRHRPVKLEIHADLPPARQGNQCQILRVTATELEALPVAGWFSRNDVPRPVSQSDGGRCVESYLGEQSSQRRPPDDESPAILRKMKARSAVAVFSGQKLFNEVS